VNLCAFLREDWRTLYSENEARLNDDVQVLIGVVTEKVIHRAPNIWAPDESAVTNT